MNSYFIFSTLKKMDEQCGSQYFQQNRYGQDFDLLT